MRYGSVCSGIEAAAKRCTKCGSEKILDQYHRSNKAKDGRASWCKSCTNAILREKRRREYSPETKRKWHLKRRYGITQAQVDFMFSAQNGLCAVCDSVLVKFHIDHCHASGAVRGLLCHRCNIRLGGWDDHAWRDRALSYLGIAKDKKGESIE